MKCLNCGHHVHRRTERCSYCNIPLTDDQIIPEAEIHSIPLDNEHCENCGAKIKPGDLRCSACNFPIEQNKDGQQVRDSRKSDDSINRMQVVDNWLEEWKSTPSFVHQM